MVENKSPICEICGKHAEVEPLGCKHYPSKVSVVKSGKRGILYEVHQKVILLMKLRRNK